MLYFCLFLLPLLASLPDTTVPPTLASTLAGGSKNIALVSVEVASVKQHKDGSTIAALKVLRVYSGPRELKGTEILAPTSEGGSVGGGLITPTLMVDEAALATLILNERTGTWKAIRVVRKNRVEDYDRFIGWAEAIEKLAGLDVTKRLALARKLCGDANPRVARLGIEVLLVADLGDIKRAGLGTFVADLPDAKNVSPAALARADELLVERDRDRRTWRDSEGRKRLLARMVEPMGEQDAESVADHLIRGVCIVSTHGAWFTADEALGLMHKITTDPRQPLAARNAAVDRVLRAGGGAVVPGFTFEVLAGVVRRGPDIAGRLHAAKGLGGYVWSVAERETLLALRRDEKDDDVRQALDAALKKVK